MQSYKKSSIDINNSFSRKAFVLFNTIFLIFVAIIMFLPYLKILSESISSKNSVDTGKVLFWPIGFNLEAYKMVFQDATIFRSLLNSVFVTVAGTMFNLVMTSMFAYPLSRSEYRGRKALLLMVTFTLIFSAPLIPSYLLVRALGIDNTFLAVIIPGAINGFYFYILRTFFMTIPAELIESARIDGCSELGVLIRIVVPVSKPAIATIALFYGVAHWNAFMGPLIYLRSTKLYTIQLKLYNLIMQNQSLYEDPDMAPAYMRLASESIKMATLVISSLPILILYPFLQKYFAKGAHLGAIKG